MDDAFDGYKIGDILASSWGHEQTNVDFYRVIRGGKIGEFVALQMIEVETTDDGPQSMTGVSVPKDPITPIPFRGSGNDGAMVLRRKVGRLGFVTITRSFRVASLWSGRPVRTSWYG